MGEPSFWEGYEHPCFLSDSHTYVCIVFRDTRSCTQKLCVHIKWFIAYAYIVRVCTCKHEPTHKAKTFECADNPSSLSSLKAKAGKRLIGEAEKPAFVTHLFFPLSRKDRGLQNYSPDSSYQQQMFPSGSQPQCAPWYFRLKSSVVVFPCSCLPDKGDEPNPPCTAAARPNMEKQCNALMSDPFKRCHHLVDPELFIKSCIYDMCKYGGMKSTLCDIVQAYVDTCKKNGESITWRNSTFCRKCAERPTWFAWLRGENELAAFIGAS